MKILNYIDIKDDHHSPIDLNQQLVHLVDKNTIQVEKKLVNKFAENSLHILVRVAPEFVTSKKTIQEQYVDLPISLLECLVLGVSYYAHSIGIISQDSVKYSIAIDKYAERYEKAIQKAMAYQVIYPTSMKDKSVENGTFF